MPCLFLGSTIFFVVICSVCVQYNTLKQKSGKNGEGLGILITWMMSGGYDVNIGGRVHIEIAY